MPYYVLRYRAKGERRDYHPLAVVAVSGAAAKGQTVTVPLLDCSEVINDDRWHVILGKMATAITVNAMEVQLSTVGSEATLELDACTFHPAMPNVAAEFTHPLTKDEREGVFAASISPPCSTTTLRQPSGDR